jgi:hypothetical protein
MFPTNPQTLDELAALLDHAQSAAEVFGVDVEGGYRRYVKICHPDRFSPGAEQEKAAKVFMRLTAWREIANGTASKPMINSPTRQYEIVKQLAVGDLADVYLATANDTAYVLKIARLAGGNPLLAGEERLLKLLCMRCGDRRYREYLPNLTESFITPKASDGRRINAFIHRHGFFTLEAVRHRHPGGLDARHLAWIFKRMLAIIGFAQTCGLVHGAVLPPHVMVHAENHGIQLLDWIHAVRIGSPLGFIPTAFRDWYPCEVFERAPVTTAMDIFLAARCLNYLAGGDPAGQRWPDTIPGEMQRFLGTCLFPSPRMRPQNAWDLHEEFDELLTRLFGSPTYHQLVMS